MKKPKYKTRAQRSRNIVGLRPAFLRLYLCLLSTSSLRRYFAPAQSFRKRPPSLAPVVTDYVRRLIELREAGADGEGAGARDSVLCV